MRDGTGTALGDHVRPLSYVLPFRSEAPASRELVTYINWLATLSEVVLVDGSLPHVYDALDAHLDRAVRHVRPHSDLGELRNGKVRGVITGLRLATCERVVLADDDVRYDVSALEQVTASLSVADVVRPQNFFHPLPWHARIDTARILINRMTGGDWPGTLAVRRSMVLSAGGYDGNVLFENLELVRTIEARGGRAVSLPAVFVRRLPPGTRHFISQRVRQAYDEFARPERLLVALAILPSIGVLLATHHWTLAAIVGLAPPITIAELGRRRNGGRRVFPFSASLCAPLWVLERAVCAWLAVGARAILGGVPYHGRVLKRAANSRRALSRRLMC